MQSPSILGHTSANLIQREQAPRLRAALLSGRYRSISIVGLGGTGKTVLAQQVLEELADDYPGGILGVHGYELARDDFSAQLDQLRTLDGRRGRKLLMIDDAGEVISERLSQVLNAAYARDSNFQVLITSRDRLSDIDLTLELGSILPSERQRLLDMYGATLSDTDRERLAELSQGHLLTMAMLGKALQSSHLSLNDFEKYLHDFDSAAILDRTGRPVERLAPRSNIITSFTTINDEVLSRLAAAPHLLYQISDRQFEEFVAELFSRQGYEVTLTPASKDGGKDLYVATRSDLGMFLFVVECKKYAPDRPVGVALVRHLYGVVESERATGGILATTSRFTRGAREFQEKIQTRLSLKDYVDLQKMLDKALRIR